MRIRRLILLATWFAFALPLSAAEIRVEGLEASEWSRLKGKMAGRLEYVLKRPAAPHRASDAAFLLRRELLQEGYYKVKVEWSVLQASDTILLQVREGSRLRLGKITFRGVDDEQEQKRLADLFALPAKEIAKGMSGAPPYIEGKIPEGVALVKMDYQSRGYWNAEVTADTPQIDTSAGKVGISLSLNPGPLFTIGDPSISGKTADAEDALQAGLSDLIGQPATTAKLNAMRKRVESWYSDRGYTFATVNFSAPPGDKTLKPAFQIDAGPRYKVGRIRIMGLDRTRPTRISRFYRPLEGGDFAAEDFARVDRGLLATGAFGAIDRELRPQADGTIDIDIAFKERRARGVSLTVGAGSYEGPIVGFGYYDRNLAGCLWSQSYGFEWTGRGLLGEVRFIDPLFFNTDARFIGRLFAFSRAQDGYDVLRGGAEAFVERKFTEHQTVRLGLTGSVVNTTENGLPIESLGLTEYGETRLYALYNLDLRDDIVLPTKGAYFNLELGAGSIFGEETTPYTRTLAEAAVYYSFGKKKDNTFVLRGRSGWLQSDKDVPIDSRFFLGGADTVRSFPQRRLGPRAGDQQLPTGGQLFWNASGEYIRPLTGPLRMVAFVDAGSLGEESDGPGGGQLELAAGLGVRLDLPVGPIRFEYGQNLSQDEGQPSGAFHFAIGLTF